jgi:MFS family permease
MGVIGAWLTYRAIYLFAVLCGVVSLVMIFRIRVADLYTAHRRATHAAAIHPRHRSAPPQRMWDLARNPALLVFAACLALFQLGNASLLPTAAGELARGSVRLPSVVASDLWGVLPTVWLRSADLVVAAWIVVPQLLAAVLSPWLGRRATTSGRRGVLLIGLVVLPIRALVFATDGNPVVMVVCQSLDGISAAVIGVMIPLVVADITHGGGRFNLGIGIVGLVSGLGGMLSTAIGGVLADRIGDQGTFLVLGAAGLAAVVLLWLKMPETHGATGPVTRPRLA